MSAASTVSFHYSSTTVTVNGPRDSDVVGLPTHVFERSAGGTPWSYQLSATAIDEWKMTLVSLTAAMKADLDDFFKTVVNRTQREFTYTHTDGETYTARFADTSLKWSRNNGADWSVPITLQIVNDEIK